MRDDASAASGRARPLDRAGGRAVGPPSDKQSSIAVPVAPQRRKTPDIHMQLDALFKSALINAMQRILMIA
jgi:hypothetical protein